MNQPALSPARLDLAIVSVNRLLEVESSPLVHPGLHPEAAEALLRQADDFSPKRGYLVCLQTPEDDQHRLAEVKRGLQIWAHEQSRRISQEIRSKIRKGGRALSMALVVVALLYVLVEWLQAFGDGYLYRIFGESLIIIAWVTLWVPAETLLIEPLNLRHQRRIFQALARAEVRLETRSETHS
jgi:hypothetical protein